VSLVQIDPTLELVGMIRRQLAAALPARPAAAQSRPRRRGPAPRQAGAGGDPRAGLGAADSTIAATIAARVRALAQDDPFKERKVFRIFLESVLLREWGPAVREEAAFQTLLEKVQRLMESDPSLQAAMQRAGRMLLQRTDPG